MDRVAGFHGGAGGVGLSRWFVSVSVKAEGIQMKW